MQIIKEISIFKVICVVGSFLSNEQRFFLISDLFSCGRYQSASRGIKFAHSPDNIGELDSTLLKN